MSDSRQQSSHRRATWPLGCPQIYLLGTLLLAACAPAPTATPPPTASAIAAPLPTTTRTLSPTPSSSPTPTSTSTPQPTATPDAHRQLIDFLSSSAALKTLSEYATAEGLNMSDVQTRLQDPKADLTLKDFKGNLFEVLADLQTEIPIFIKENGEWNKLSINKTFETIGKEAQVRGEPGGGPQIPVLSNFGGINVTTTLEGTVSYIDTYGWRVPDAFADMTQHPVLGQIAWGYQPIIPESILNLPPEKLGAFAISQIHEVLNHFFQKYPDKRYDFIIAGESTEPTLYHNKLGDPNKYLIDQYAAADNDITAAGRKRAKNVGNDGDRLAYSDFISGVDDPNLGNIINIAKTLKAKNLLDVLYLQLRYVGSPNIDPTHPPSREQLKALPEKIFNESGVPVIFSEVGIQGKGDPKTIFENTVGGCVDSPVCLGVQFYAVGKAEDGQNQYPIFDTVNGQDLPNSLYFDIMKLILNLS